jgi:uncharacterized protein DUF5989
MSCREMAGKLADERTVLTCTGQHAKVHPSNVELQSDNCGLGLQATCRARDGAIMKFLHRAALNVGVIAELLSFFGSNKRWWLLPMLITLFLFGVLIVVAQSSAVAPFVYTLF